MVQWKSTCIPSSQVSARCLSKDSTRISKLRNRSKMSLIESRSCSASTRFPLVSVVNCLSAVASEVLSESEWRRRIGNFDDEEPWTVASWLKRWSFLKNPILLRWQLVSRQKKVRFLGSWDRMCLRSVYFPRTILSQWGHFCILFEGASLPCWTSREGFCTPSALGGWGGSLRSRSWISIDG